MLSRERVTCCTQLCCDPKVTLLSEFVFKGKGTRTYLVPPEGMNYQWVSKGSHRIEQMLETIKKLPNRFSLFTEKGFAICVLNDYPVHLIPEIQQALFKKGYILVIVGGGITGDIQINDTHCQNRLKSQYRDLETKLMPEQLEKNPTKIFPPSRNEMMSMLLASWERLQIDTENFKHCSTLTRQMAQRTIQSLRKYYLIIEKDPYIVEFFDPAATNDVYKLNDLKFEVFPEDFVRKLEEPLLIPVGRS